MKDPEKTIKNHYYGAKRRYERFCRIRDSNANKAKKAIWNASASEALEVVNELENLYMEIFEKEI